MSISRVKRSQLEWAMKCKYISKDGIGGGKSASFAGCWKLPGQKWEETISMGCASPLLKAEPRRALGKSLRNLVRKQLEGSWCGEAANLKRTDDFSGKQREVKFLSAEKLDTKLWFGASKQTQKACSELRKKIPNLDNKVLISLVYEQLLEINKKRIKSPEVKCR